MAKPTKLDAATLRWVAKELDSDASWLRRHARMGVLPEHLYAERASLLEGYAKRWRARATRAERKAGRDG